MLDYPPRRAIACYSPMGLGFFFWFPFTQASAALLLRLCGGSPLANASVVMGN